MSVRKYEIQIPACHCPVCLVLRSLPSIARHKWPGISGMAAWAGRSKPLAQTPGPDLAWQDAVMESEAFIISENICIPTSRRTRAGWHAMAEFHSFCVLSIMAPKAYSNHVAPGRAETNSNDSSEISPPCGILRRRSAERNSTGQAFHGAGQNPNALNQELFAQSNPTLGCFKF